jgi:PadR family transcriptional regulator, regulatory protein PadR
MADPHLDLPQGTLDLLILKTLALEPQHGWALSNRIRQVSSDALNIQQGTLYPALHRLERRGWIRSRWETTDNNRRAKYYELTATGRKQLEQETMNWQHLTAAVAQVLESAYSARPCGDRDGVRRLAGVGPGIGDQGLGRTAAPTLPMDTGTRRTCHVQ